MGAGMIKGDVEQIQQSATKLGDFSTELNDTLTRLRGTVDDISAITYGTASETLTSTYYQLDNDLKTYVTELETLSKNVMTSSNNLESIDEAASSGLSYN
uniref:WXG100 family type VII secretion target n=2 Tax=Butyrivibrio proteoclasticus TaxID=43305 RepID=UPI00047AEBA2